MTPKIFIDGEAGTTGLQIRSRLQHRTDIELLSIDPARRKDADARAELLNAADLLIWGTESQDDVTALEAEPFVAAIDAMKKKSVVYTDGVTAGAIYFTSPLSLPYVIDALVPALADAVAGDGPGRTAE